MVTKLQTGRNDAVLITCEHGGNRVPAGYAPHLSSLKAALQTHRGQDFGALVLARELAAAFGAPMVHSTVTRLLVDLNRSIGHPHLHGEPLRQAPAALRERIVAEHYRPYRAEVEALVEASIARGQRVVHVSSHSFTPELHGHVRTADVGLLYDPARPGEVALAARWKATLAEVAPTLRVRRNYPYQGRNDGFTSSLRRAHGPADYVGIEIEVNQAIVFGPPSRWAGLRATLVGTLRDALVSP